MLKKRPDMSMSNAELKEMVTQINLKTEAIDSKAFGFISAEPLLYIYNCKSKNRCPDESKIKKLGELFEKSQEGVGNYGAKKDHKFRVTNGGYMGHHTCSCGEASSACDYLLPGNQYFTNSLCVHYLECHYDDIDEDELEKLDDLLG